MTEITALATLAGAIVGGVATILVAGINLWGKLAEIAQDAAEARNQVQNHHKTNLRDDVTGIMEQLARLHEAAAAEHDAIWTAVNDLRGEPPAPIPTGPVPTRGGS